MALKYLENRGINQDSVNQFNLGVYSKNGSQWIAIPHYQGDNLVNIKFRSLPPADNTFRRIPDCKSILFNVDALHGKDEIIITEGEIDAITLLQAGIDNVIGATNGAGAFDAEWVDQLKPIKKSILSMTQIKLAGRDLGQLQSDLDIADATISCCRTARA